MARNASPTAASRLDPPAGAVQVWSPTMPSLAMLLKAKHFIEMGDHAAFAQWLNRRTPSERIAILDHVRDYPGKRRTMTLVNPRHLPSADAIQQIADRAEKH